MLMAAGWNAGQETVPPIITHTNNVCFDGLTYLYNKIRTIFLGSQIKEMMITCAHTVHIHMLTPYFIRGFLKT